MWFVLGIVTAIFFALTHIISKYVADRADPYYISNAVWIISSILALPLLFIFWPKLIITVHSLIGFIIIGLITFSTQIIFLTSLKQGTLSRTVPLLSITPVFTLIIAMVWLKEFPAPTGILGIIFMVSGTYVLNAEYFSKSNFIEPLISICNVKSSRLMLIVAFAYGFGSVADKFVINHSNVISRVVIFSYFTVFFNTLYLLLKDKREFFPRIIVAFRFWKSLVLFNILYLLMLLFQMYGLTLTHTVYIISLKRTSALFSVVLAYFIFQEKKYFWSILSGTVLMVIGAILIVL